jgi:hypothetical protein
MGDYGLGDYTMTEGADLLAAMAEEPVATGAGRKLLRRRL